MKKFLVFLFILMFSISFVFASKVNGERLIDVDSPVFEAVKVLYLETGYALPSTTGPWSESEVMGMLNKLDASSFSQTEKNIYDYILNEISHKEDVFKFGLEANLELYIHTDKDNFTSREKWGRDYNQTKPFFTAFMNAWIADNFYGYFSLNLATAKILANKDGVDKFGSTVFSTNIPLVPPSNMNTMDFEFPHKAYLSAGGAQWSLTLGRFNIGWGNGKSGNFIIGSHLGQHDALRFSTWTKNQNFKYTFLIDSFPHPMNYYFYESGNANNGIQQNKGSQEHLKGTRLFLSHRLEWRILRDKLNLTLTEGLMWMSEDGFIDLAVLNPSMFWHNLYTRAHSNSILSFEADYTILKGLNVYAQVVMDEFLLPGEPVPGKDGQEPAEPSAFGYMVGVTYLKDIWEGMLKVNLEGAYTDPFLYLRDGANGSYRHQERGQYGINFVVALRNIYQTGGNIFYNEQYLGYRYGGDSIVGNLNATFDTYKKWNAEFNFFFMAHGTTDRWTVWTRINPDKNHDYPKESPVTPTTKHVSDNHKDAASSNRDSVEYTLDFTLKGGYEIIKNLKSYLTLDFISVINPGNLKSAGVHNDLQLTLGLSYEL